MFILSLRPIERTRSRPAGSPFIAGDLGPINVTPETARLPLAKEAAGFAEFIRLEGMKKTPFAALSRSLLAGARRQTLILCLPGSPKVATESLDAVLKLLPHAVDLLQGRTGH